jgi:hypothetical protein
MKWFVAVTSQSPLFTEFAQMLQVAVATAAERTSLEPHVLYDGDDDNWLTDWLQRRSIPIVRVRGSYHGQLEQLARRFGYRDAVRGHSSGALLRVELPAVTSRLGLPDQFILFTDVDVMFHADPVPLLTDMRPRYLAATPEKHEHDGLNAGVMLMNLPALRRDAPGFQRYLARNLERFSKDGAWEQRAYQEYYAWAHPPVALRKVARRLHIGGDPLWDRLPLTMNWKPYWGENPRAAIIHFHGPKPYQSERAAAGALNPDHQDLVTENYFRLSEEWRERIRTIGAGA